MNPSVKITVAVSVSIGTSLGPPLLNEARTAANEAIAATDPNTELQRCLVAILCGHAAVAAQINEVGDAIDPVLAAPREEEDPGQVVDSRGEAHQSEAATQ
jgi:hypothetical protein